VGVLVALSVSINIAARESDERILEESRNGENWFLKGGNFRGEHFSPLSEINASNVDELGLSWATDLPIPDGIAATPIVVDGVIYLSGAYSVVYAVDAANGEVLWNYDPDVRAALANDPSLSWIARASRGVAVWGDRVYVNTADCRLVALSAKTGMPQWTRKTCDPAKSFSVSDSPYVGGGKVFVGNAGSESPEVNRGYVSAYDAENGELVWRFYIVPSADPADNDTPALKMAAKSWSGDTLAKHGGGGHSWNEMTYDPASNQLFFGTSGAYPYIYEQRSPDGGDNLFLSSIVAVDADTGEYNWHYQTVDRDSWDFNATMNIVVADLRIDDKDRETVLIAPKNGFHYALDRHTGELLTAGKFAKTNWASHINMETGRPVYDPAGEYWNAEEGATTIVWPNMWGSHSWNPMAFHPTLKLSYIPVVDAPSMMTSDGEGDFNDDIVMLTEVDGRAHSPGKLVAFDPVSQTVRWRVDHKLPFNGGVMATAGNLVFQGNAEGEFAAYAADSGEQLWSVNTGTAINAAPASYAVDGTQHIVIPIGAGGGVQFYYPDMHASASGKGPTRLLAFSLAGDSDLPDVSVGPRQLPEQPPLTANDEQLAFGKEIYSWACKNCHGLNAVARFGGSVPDLRYATMDTHNAWQAIVIGGAKRMNGMPSFELSLDESDAVRQYVLSLADSIRRNEIPE